MNNKLKKRKAFTLVEVIIYILLFGIISVGLVDSSIRLSQQSQDAVLQEQLILESSLSFNKVTDLVHSAKNLNESLSNLDQNLSHLAFIDDSGDLQEFFVTNGILQQRTNSGSPISLHSTDISVNRFYVSRLNPSSSTPLLKFNLGFEDALGHYFSLTNSLNFRHD